jgi:hypothetical protein
MQCESVAIIPRLRLEIQIQNIHNSNIILEIHIDNFTIKITGAKCILLNVPWGVGQLLGVRNILYCIVFYTFHLQKKIQACYPGKQSQHGMDHISRTRA